MWEVLFWRMRARLLSMHHFPGLPHHLNFQYHPSIPYRGKDIIGDLQCQILIMADGKLLASYLTNQVLTLDDRNLGHSSQYHQVQGETRGSQRMGSRKWRCLDTAIQTDSPSSHVESTSWIPRLSPADQLENLLLTWTTLEMDEINDKSVTSR